MKTNPSGPKADLVFRIFSATVSRASSQEISFQEPPPLEPLALQGFFQTTGVMKIFQGGLPLRAQASFIDGAVRVSADLLDTRSIQLNQDPATGLTHSASGLYNLDHID